jgi:hypothetical protein
MAGMSPGQRMYSAVSRICNPQAVRSFDDHRQAGRSAECNSAIQQSATRATWLRLRCIAQVRVGFHLAFRLRACLTNGWCGRLARPGRRLADRNVRSATPRKSGLRGSERRSHSARLAPCDSGRNIIRESHWLYLTGRVAGRNRLVALLPGTDASARRSVLVRWRIISNLESIPLLRHQRIGPH